MSVLRSGEVLHSRPYCVVLLSPRTIAAWLMARYREPAVDPLDLKLRRETENNFLAQHAWRLCHAVPASMTR